MRSAPKQASVEVIPAGAQAMAARTRIASIAASVSRNRIRLAVVLVLGLGLGLRAAVYFEAPKAPDGAGLAAEQGLMARNIVDHGRWFVVNPAAADLVTKRQIRESRLIDLSQIDFSKVDRASDATPIVDQMPGIAVVLAGIWWVTGDQTYTSLQWLQILIDTAMVLLVYWIASRLTRSTPVAMMSALLYALWPGAIVLAKRPVLDTWAGFFAIGCVAVFVWAREQPASRSRLVLLGLVAGVGIYFRPFLVLLPAALALVATPGGGWRRRLVWIFAPTIVALLVLAPWTIRNYYEFNRFIPTRTGVGQALFEGTGLAARGDQSAKSYVKRHRRGATYGSPAYDDFLLSGAARAIADHPSLYLSRIGRRAGRFLLPCLLIVFAWRRWRSAGLIAVAAAAAIVLPYLLIGDDTRFYLPAAFAYIILVAMAAEVAVAKVFRRKALAV
jgi:4-amino-4-deoxy-L-arabinose transferase-like glycosyltransferase